MASDSIVGREEELAAIDRLLDAAGLPAGLVLAGEVGVGKTTLWRHAVSWASLTYTVLSCSPTEAEQVFGYGGLIDLLDGVADDLLPTLPPPQRSALARALLVDTDDPVTTDPRGVSVALLNCLRRLASERPVLLAVDDVQWLDAGSATALSYAIRRLGTEPVAVLLGRRLGTAPTELERLVGQRLELGPLPMGAIHRLVHERHGSALSRTALHRLYGRSGGNPFFALELATADSDSMPSGIQELIGRRLDALPATTAEAMAGLSVLGRSSPELLQELTGADSDAIASAVEAGVAALQDGLVLFAHPLFASVAYERQRDNSRRALHQRAADLLAEPEARARNLALSLDAPDESVAEQCELAAMQASARGAPSAAATLYELAIRVGEPDAANRRRLAAAHEHVRASELVEASSLLELLIVQLPPGPQRAAALAALSSIEEDLDRQASLLEQAIGEAAGVPALVGKTLRELAMTRAFAGQLDAALDHLEDALTVFGETDSAELALAIGSVSALSLFAGRPKPDALIERLRRVQPSFDLQRWDRVEGLEAFRSSMLGRPRTARVTYELYRHEMRDTGDERRLEHAFRHLTHLAILEGDVAEAERLLPEHAQLVALAGLSTRGAYIEALVHSYAGRVKPARLSIGELRAAATAGRDFFFAGLADSLEGFLELSLGDFDRAWQLLGPLIDRFESHGFKEIGWLPTFHANAIETAVGVGELERAAELTARLERRSARLESVIGLAGATRARGLLASAGGDFETAALEFARSSAQADGSGLAFEAARSRPRRGCVAASREALGRGPHDARTVLRRLRASRHDAVARSRPERVGARPGAKAARLDSDTDRVAHRRTRRGRPYEQGGCRCGVRNDEDGGGAPVEDLRKARRALAHGVGSQLGRAKTVGISRLGSRDLSSYVGRAAA